VADALPLTKDLHAAATLLLAEAFHDNPAHVYICPDESRRPAQLRWFLGRNVEVQSRVGSGFCLIGDGRLDAMGFWHAPGTKEPGLAMMIRHGLAMAPVHLGMDSMRRLLEVVHDVETERQAVLNGTEAWYLHNMVVRKELRGTGVGGPLLRSQLRDVLGRRPHRKAVLATQKPENVTFYQRLGFEVVSEKRVGSRPGAFLNWLMVHPGVA